MKIARPFVFFTTGLSHPQFKASFLGTSNVYQVFTTSGLLRSFMSPCLWHAVLSSFSFFFFLSFFLLIPLLTLSTSEIPIHHSVNFSQLSPYPKRVRVVILCSHSFLSTFKKSCVTYFLISSISLNLLRIGTSFIYLLYI